ncbi:MAG: hypothetical protein QOE97_1888 [Pseudonocardiales bacterium]|jgi:hypothetical protein|nr:hypothetical protein [Pseudonocardiales bacterium]
MRDDRADGEDADETPQPVIWSVALGVGPLPFLAVYAVLFLAHGLVYPVNPPDITSTRGGEAIAGVVAVVLFLLATIVLFWFLNGRRRWPFVIAQLAVFATSVAFILDSTTGSPAVPVVLALTSCAAVVLAAVPASWPHTGFSPPSRRRQARPPASGGGLSAARRGEDSSLVFGADDVDAAISDVRT